MDVIQQESVRIPRSVVASLTGLETDEEVSAFLQKYGSINAVSTILIQITISTWLLNFLKTTSGTSRLYDFDSDK